MTEHLPHEQYISDVFERLSELGAEVVDDQTSTPDGETLDGWITFAHNTHLQQWPGGVHLSWDQNQGWSLCDEGSRTLFPLDLDTYAHPRAVAHRAIDRLTDSPDGNLDHWNGWPGAVHLKDAVQVWEKAGR